MHATKSRIYQETLRTTEIQPRAGVAETFRAAKEQGLKVGLVTTTSADNLAALGEALARARHPRQDELIANCQDAFSFAAITDELAALVFDSLWEDKLESASRATVIATRTLAFESDDLSLEIEFSGDGGEPIATVGGVELLASEGIDAEAVEKRIEERREKLRAEVKRGEGKLSNEGFVDKAPADVVDAERAKLEAYRAELEELST